MKARNRPAIVVLLLAATGLVVGVAPADQPSWPAGAASPYLVGHATDGVRWQPWDAERPAGRLAFVLLGRFGSPRWDAAERAFLATPEAREALDRWFVPVLVDGEERPDLAELCRLAARLGNDLPAASLDAPLGALLTPQGRPVLVRPLTRGLALSLERWMLEYRELPGDVEARAGVTAAQLGMTAPPSSGPVDRAQLVAHALRGLRDSFDTYNGGFGATPQSVPHGGLRLLLAEAARSGDAGELRMATRTLDAIVLGALHDHVGGGFFHATSDAAWRLPRFEKTLADNALLLDALVRAHALTGTALYREAGIETADWILRDLKADGGGFVASVAALDADDEGGFYLFSRHDLEACLGRQESSELQRAYHLEPTGLLLPSPSSAFAAAAARERLRQCRSRRPGPAVDPRVFVNANGLAIGALAASGHAWDRSGDIDAAERAAYALVDGLGPLPDLRRFGPDGAAPRSAQLDDYAGLAWGLAQLGGATGEARWAELGTRVVDAAIDRFHDSEQGGFYATEASDHPLSVRLKPVYDTERPSANALMVEALVHLARLTGQSRLRAIAGSSVAAFSGEMQRAPRGLESMALATALYDDGGSQVRSSPLPSPAAGTTKVTLGPVAVEARVVNPPVRPGHFVDVAITLQIASPAVLPAARPLDADLVPTSVSVLEPDLRVEQIRYPDGTAEHRSFGAQLVRVYSGEVAIVVTLRVPRDARPGKRSVRMRVRFQTCSGSDCRPPASGILEVPMEIVPPL